MILLRQSTVSIQAESDFSLVSLVEYNRGDKKRYTESMSETFSFGAWMARRRKALDMTQRELAARTNCALATIKKIELDERRPSRDLAEALAGALHIPADAQSRFVESARGLRPATRLRTRKPRRRANGQRRFHYSPSILPTSVTPLIGRTSELAQICAIARSARLPPSDTGRFGRRRQNAAGDRSCPRQREHFADGAVFVPLAAVSDAALIPTSIAQSLRLGCRARPRRSFSPTCATKSLLLVLDNCEQLVEGVGWLSDLLANAPEIKLLATSRERLQLAEEWLYSVPMLDESQAVALFNQMAQRLNPQFQSSEQACGCYDGLQARRTSAAGD